MVILTKILAILLVAINLASVNVLYGQVELVSSGGRAQSTAGSASFSVGQVFYGYFSSSSGSSSIGVQNNIDIETQGFIDGRAGLKVKIYPNPTCDFLQVYIDGDFNGGWSYTLYDLAGREILSGDLEDIFSKVSLQTLPASSYRFVISQSNIRIQSFQIIKS